MISDSDNESESENELVWKKQKPRDSEDIRHSLKRKGGIGYKGESAFTLKENEHI